MNIKFRIIVSSYILGHLTENERWMFFVAIAGVIASSVAFFTNNRYIAFWIAIVTLIVDIVLFFRDFLNITNPRIAGLKLVERKDIIESEEKPKSYENIQLSKRELDDGFRIKRLNNGNFVVVNDNLDNVLTNGKGKEIKVRPNMGHEENVINAHQAVLQHLRDFFVLYAKPNKLHANEKKVAITSGFGRNTNNVELGFTTYITSMITNEASRYMIMREEKIYVDFWEILYPINYNMELKSIEFSTMSNHIGISTLALTKDNTFALWSQAAKTDQEAGSVMPSGSGSLDWDDYMISRGKNLQDVLCYGIARELYEESIMRIGHKIHIMFFTMIIPSMYYFRLFGLKPLKWIHKKYEFFFRRPHKKISDLSENTLIIGYYRWLDRGGKPEFVGISKITDFKRDELRNQKDEVDELDLCKQVIETIDDLEVFCTCVLESPKNRYRLGTSLSVILERLLFLIRTGRNGGENDDELQKVIEFWGLKEVVEKSAQVA